MAISVKIQIERLAELNTAAQMIGLAPNLKEEHKYLMKILRGLKVIAFEDDNGFIFIGEDSPHNQKIYNDACENF